MVTTTKASCTKIYSGNKSKITKFKKMTVATYKKKKKGNAVSKGISESNKTALTSSTDP
jgi:pyruvate dehydrogenase complex dehydrogenase (E1) component